MMRLYREIESAERLSTILQTAQAGDKIELCDMGEMDPVNLTEWGLSIDGVVYQVGHRLFLNGIPRRPLSPEAVWEALETSPCIWWTEGEQIFQDDTLVYKGPFDDFRASYDSLHPFVRKGDTIFQNGRKVCRCNPEDLWLPYSRGRVLISTADEPTVVLINRVEPLFEGSFDSFCTDGNIVIFRQVKRFVSIDKKVVLDAEKIPHNNYAVHARGIVFEHSGVFTLHVTN